MTARPFARPMIARLCLALLAATLLAACANDTNVRAGGDNKRSERVGLSLGLPF